MPNGLVKKKREEKKREEKKKVAVVIIGFKIGAYNHVVANKLHQFGKDKNMVQPKMLAVMLFVVPMLQVVKLHKISYQLDLLIYKNEKLNIYFIFII